MYRLFAAIMLVLVLSACDDAEPPKNVEIIVAEGTSQADATMVINAVNVLVARCPAILNYWHDLKEPKAAMAPAWLAENAGWDKTRGWGRVVDFQVTVVDRPKQIPSSWRAFLHTLFFRMGGGDKPGIEMTKDQAAKFCGHDAGGIIMDVPELAFIK